MLTHFLIDLHIRSRRRHHYSSEMCQPNENIEVKSKWSAQQVENAIHFHFGLKTSQGIQLVDEDFLEVEAGSLVNNHCYIVLLKGEGTTGTLWIWV